MPRRVEKDKKYDESRKGTRTRNWATVVYPESAPANWETILAECHSACFVSPLHDSDINPDGTPKKEHYHVIVMFDAVKNRDQVKELFDRIGGVGTEKISSLRGYARYLCHLDNPEKHQYSPDDVKAYGGADYISVIGLPTDKYKAIDEMIDYCEENNVYSFAELIIYARGSHRDWFRVLCDSGAVVIEKYLKSKFWTESILQKEQKK